MATERRAWIYWNQNEHTWVLRLLNGETWDFSKSWEVMTVGKEELTGNPIDLVRDSILCEIAHLQDLGYDVKITLYMAR